MFSCAKECNKSCECCKTGDWFAGAWFLEPGRALHPARWPCKGPIVNKGFNYGLNEIVHIRPVYI
jgi:hypothetical protein